MTSDSQELRQGDELTGAGGVPDIARKPGIIAHVGNDIVTVLLTATLLVLPTEDGSYWPAAFVAMVPLLLRMWTRSYLSIFFLGFSSFYLYLFYVLDWMGPTYGWHWLTFLAFMNAVSYGAAFVVAFWLMRKYRSHFFALTLPAVLMVVEFWQTIGFLGFPWPLLCHSQAKNLPLLQIASLGGCWAVTLLLVNVNEALAHLIAGHFKPKILPIAVLPVLLICFSGLWGAITLAHTPENSDVLATIVQGSESTDVAWTSEFNKRAIDQYRDLTRGELMKEGAANPEEAAKGTKRLVLWPETAIPEAVIDYTTMAQIQALASAFDATFIVGCLTLDPADGKPLDLESAYLTRSSYDQYNSLVAFEPDRTVVPLYSKVHLVPFGEVIPLKPLVTKWFPAYPWGSNDIMPGDGFHVTETGVGRIGAVVCYESFFPEIPRRQVAQGADILVLGSNTSWFKETRATFQHADFDVFRAVENGVWFCRAATTGVSSVIDPQGRVWVETPIFKAEAFTVPIGVRKATTLYTRLGDWIPAISGIFLLMLLLGAFVVNVEKPA